MPEAGVGAEGQRNSKTLGGDAYVLKVECGEDCSARSIY